MNMGRGGRGMGKRFRRKDGILFGFQMFLWGLYVNFVFSFVLFNKTKKIISFENPGKKRDEIRTNNDHQMCCCCFISFLSCI